jgi:L-aminopeptidase/D-esterase-like protein
MHLPSAGALTDVAGLLVGHAQHPERATGCTVVLAPEGVVAGVDVRGAAPGTRETDLLEPGNLVDRIDGLVLSGGSAFGLDAASGVMRWLEAHGHGFATPHGKVPIVPAAVLYDLAVLAPGQNAQARPHAETGYQAASAATSSNPAEGSIGAGCGATVGKLFGMARAMKGGLGQASVQVGPWVVSALVVCNAVGDVVDPDSGQLIAGARSPDGRQLLNTQQALLSGATAQPPVAGSNTTIGVIACNARLDKAQARRLATSAHDGLARSVRPAHTSLDGDTLFALATGACPQAPDLLLLGAMAAEACARATVRAATQSTGLDTVHGYVPAAGDLHQHSASS